MLKFFIKTLILLMLFAYLAQGLLTQGQTISNEEEVITVSDDPKEQANTDDKEIRSESPSTPSTPTSPASSTTQGSPRKDPVTASARRAVGKVKAVKKKVMNVTNETTANFLTSAFGWFNHVYVPEHGFWKNVWYLMTSQPIVAEVVLPSVFVFWLILPCPYLYYAAGSWVWKAVFMVSYSAVNYNTIRSAGAFSHRVPEIEFGNFSASDSYAESTLKYLNFSTDSYGAKVFIFAYGPFQSWYSYLVALYFTYHVFLALVYATCPLTRRQASTLPKPLVLAYGLMCLTAFSVRCALYCLMGPGYHVVAHFLTFLSAIPGFYHLVRFTLNNWDSNGEVSKYADITEGFRRELNVRTWFHKVNSKEEMIFAAGAFLKSLKDYAGTAASPDSISVIPNEAYHGTILRIPRKCITARGVDFVSPLMYDDTLMESCYLYVKIPPDSEKATRSSKLRFTFDYDQDAVWYDVPLMAIHHLEITATPPTGRDKSPRVLKSAARITKGQIPWPLFLLSFLVSHSTGDSNTKTAVATAAAKTNSSSAPPAGTSDSPAPAARKNAETQNSRAPSETRKEKDSADAQPSSAPAKEKSTAASASVATAPAKDAAKEKDTQRATSASRTKEWVQQTAVAPNDSESKQEVSSSAASTGAVSSDIAEMKEILKMQNESIANLMKVVQHQGQQNAGGKKKPITCHNCKQEGHMSRDCPHPKGDSSSERPGRATAPRDSAAASTRPESASRKRSSSKAKKEEKHVLTADEQNDFFKKNDLILNKNGKVVPRPKKGLAPRDISVQFPTSTLGAAPGSTKVAAGSACWLACAVAALIHVARALTTSPNMDKRFLKFKDVTWAARHGSKLVFEITKSAYPDAVINQPFDASHAVSACFDELKVKEGKQTKLSSMVRCGFNMPRHCSAFFLLRFHKKGSAASNHWEPLALDDASNKFISLQDVPEPTGGEIRDYKIWIKKSRPAVYSAPPSPPSDTTPINAAKPKSAERSEAHTESASSLSPDAPAFIPATADSAAAPSERPRSIRFTNPLVDQDGRRFVPTDDDESPATPDASLNNKSSADIFQCRRESRTRLGGAVEGSRLPQSEVVVGKRGLPEAQRRVAQLHQSDGSGSSQNAPRSPRSNPKQSSTSRSSSRGSNSSSSGPRVNGGSSPMATNLTLPRNDEDGRCILELGEVRDGNGSRNQAVRLDHLEKRSQNLEECVDGGSTSESTRCQGGGDLKGDLAHRGQGGSLVHHVALAPMRSQGRYRSSPPAIRSREGQWTNRSVHSRGQGSQGPRGEVPRDLALPSRMEGRTLELPQQQATREVPLPSLSRVLPRSSSLPASRRSDSLMPLRSSWSGPSTRRIGNSGRSDHEDDGSQVPHDSPSLLELGPDQRIGSLQGSGRSQEGAQSQQTALNAATLRSESSSASAYTTANSFTFQPKLSHIVAGTSAARHDSVPTDEEISKFPIHVKKLDRRLDFTRLFELPTNDTAVSDTAKSAWETYLMKPDVYEASLPIISSRGLYRANIRPSHTLQLIDGGIAEFVSDLSDVRGRCKLFNIHELLKLRDRNIQHTEEINKLVADAPDVFFETLDNRRRLVHAGSHILQRDFKAYYHQFPLSEEVRKFHCFRSPMEDGTYKVARLCVGPTGQKHMVHVAVATTDHLLAFDKSCKVDTQIDNVGFFGSPDACCSAYEQFAERCAYAGASFNDHSDDSRSLLETEADWMGMHLNMSKKTVSLTAKTVKKLQVSWHGRSGWSWQGFAAHLGLLWWSSQVLKVRPCFYYEVLRFASRVGQQMQEADDKNWHLPAEVPERVWSELRSWTEVAIGNKPVLVPPRRDAEIFILVDASSYGWGYVAWDTVTNKTYSYGEQWSGAFAERNKAFLERSTFTEPWGIVNTKRHLLRQIDRKNPTLFFGSDNNCSVFVFNKRFSTRSYNLNMAVKTDEEEFGHLQCDYAHVPGSKNCMADGNSRGRYAPSAHGADAIKDSLRQLLGEIPSCCGLRRGWASEADAICASV